jgi:hypothetical protein
MARIPTRFAGPAALTTGAVTQATVAASEKNIIRHIHAQSPVTGTITISIGTDAAGKRIHDATAITANVPFNDYCYYILDAAEVIQAFASTTSVVLTIDGERVVLG